MTKKKNLFAARDIANTLNNAVTQSLRPASTGEIPEVRIRTKLRPYSQAALAALLKHVEEELLRPEELVMVLATAALFVQLKYVMHTDKLPQGRRVTDLYEGKEAVVLSREYLAAGEPAPDEILPRLGKKGRRGKK